tara:strand:+ start:298 stop:540 length:243 start_codon:yes stop_codon:yes gene_type:complete
MTPEDLKKHSEMIDNSVTFIEQQTEAIWQRYDEIDDCYTEECNKEKATLRNEMDGYLKKLEEEEKMIDQYEEMLHNTGRQ